jgi:hypothetical protein
MSTLLISHLLSSHRGNEVFRSADHMPVMREVKSEIKSRKKAKMTWTWDQLSLNCLAISAGQLSEAS